MKKTPDKKHKGTRQKPIPATRTEKDADDLVHSQQEEFPREAGEEDLDDLIHQPQQPRADRLNENQLEDFDDLIHRNPEEEGDEDKM